MFKIAWKNVWHKPLHAVLSLLLFALGVGMISFMLLVKNQVQENFEKNLANIDLVIGAKGSPLQLILCSMYHIDNPTGNISFSAAQPFMNPNHPLIAKAVPLSIGDNFQGYRIVGTTTAYPELYDAQLERGNLFSEAMDVCIGADVSAATALKLGDEFLSTHGLIKIVGDFGHDKKFKVTGIFKQSGTVLDQLILCPLESIWTVHASDAAENNEKEKAITSLLIKYRNRTNFQVLNLPRNINENTNLQAAVPAIEMNRLYILLGAAEKALRILAFVIIVVSGLSIFISLLNALKERKNELALMRVMGASGIRLFSLILFEAGILSFIGSALGCLLSHSAMVFFNAVIRQSYRYSSLGTSFLTSEVYLFFSAVFIGFIAGIIPAIMAYKTGISTSLGQN